MPTGASPLFYTKKQKYKPSHAHKPVRIEVVEESTDARNSKSIAALDLHAIIFTSWPVFEHIQYLHIRYDRFRIETSDAALMVVAHAYCVLCSLINGDDDDYDDRARRRHATLIERL